MNIDQMMPVSNLFQDVYNSSVERGKQHLENKHVVFAIITRDSENTIGNCVSKLADFISQYAYRYDFVIYENDSIDKTREVLIQLSEEYATHIRLIFEDLGLPKFGSVKNSERTTLLSRYRNNCLRHIKENFEETTYTVVCDGDFLDVSLEGILHSFGKFDEFPELHALCGNSFQLKDRGEQKPFLWNYDSWAFRDGHWHDVCLDYNEYCYNPAARNVNFGLWYPPVGMGPKQINSGFGGMAIYKTESYIQGVYEGLDCEHVRFHWSLYRNVPKFILSIDPAMRMLMPC